jgi:hypothetical protein
MKLQLQLVLLAITVVGLSACGSSAERQAVDRAQIEAMLTEYLPALGQAYAMQNANLIAEHAAPKEVARVHQRILELGEIGSILEPVFHRVTVEEAQIWNNSNAFVTTVETWDVKRFALGTRQSLGEELEKTNRVKYQLKREQDGSWLVLYRTIEG